MRHSILIDTGPLYALADRSDNYHKQAHEEFSTLEKQQYRITLVYPTMMEAYTLIMRYLGLKYAHRWLDSLMKGSALLNPTSTDYHHAAQQIAKFLDQEITLFDAVLATISDRLQVPVWTYDSDFDVMGIRVWRVAQ